ncbi:type VII secretion EsaA-like protein [Scopulibacillus darangshiensis]|uniref:Type VII secretion EsaA-like protein n=1 Tax=Scopulibacillus darangshiensis TaxID=442528 RepID=A0A4R2P8N0_9BACL|nr:type VII secretion protein EsaA [Scopulibacillus darangshiensis]TCP31207.1 type VII secretion EsaA-like protein [Scopulibacillus darangshiensis]
MTGKWKPIVKVVITVVIILALPSLFFEYIGQNPMKVKENATRKIAVVNEDLGVKNDNGDPTRFGQDIVPVLEKNSDYTWTVLSRSAADNGLESLKYDAIIYIPSHFTQNILTYDEDQPKKAMLHYEVQDQLNAVNKEKVLRELKSDTDKVNNHISSLYWSYVSQEVDNVRGQFNDILNKEIAFQDAMISFYSPSSKNLTDELNRQKELLKQLQSNIKSAEEGSAERKGDVQQVEDRLTNFVDYVNAYKKYQENQKKILQKVQGQSEETITQGMDTISKRQSQLDQTFGNHAAPMLANMTTIQQMINGNNEKFADLNNMRLDQIDEQKELLKSLFSKPIDQNSQTMVAKLDGLQPKIITLRESLKNSDEQNENNSEKGESGEISQTGSGQNNEDVHPQSGQSDVKAPNTETEQSKLTEIAGKMDVLKKKLSNLPEPPPKETINQLDKLANEIRKTKDSLAVHDNNDKAWLEKQLGSLRGTIEDLQGQIEDLGTENDNLKKVNNELQSKINELEKSLGESNANVDKLVKKIYDREQDILKSALSQDRKDKLYQAFDAKIKSRNVEKLVQYYDYLAHYQSFFNGLAHDNALKNSITDGEISQGITNIISMTDKEKSEWNELTGGLSSAKQTMADFKKSNEDFVNSYNKYIDEQQAAVMDSLNSIQESAGVIDEKLQQPDDIVTDGSTATASPDGTILLNLQKGMGQELKSMNKLMDSMGERQTNIVDYTSQLQKKVDGVQEKADTLNNKWAKNVSSTRLVKKNVYDILGNTLVDGQDNGYVYKYLSNPLQISGEVPTDKQKTVPPVVVLVIILISSLLIGYFSHYYKDAPLLVRGSLFGLLNIIVGLMISVFGLNIYSLADDRAIQWSIFTILLLLASSTLVRVGFGLGSLIGWFVSIGLILFYITPLLDLAMPNFNYQDPISKVYMSIQYDPSSQFVVGSVFLLVITAMLTAIPFIARLIKSDTNLESEQSHEA